MNSRKYLQPNSILCGLTLALGLTSLAPSARANVYATNIKLNGSLTNVTTVQGAGVAIRYVLNEAASSGVTVNILSDTNVVRTINVAGGSPGSTRGTNSVFWDTTDNGSNDVPGGIYSVSI